MPADGEDRHPHPLARRARARRGPVPDARGPAPAADPPGPGGRRAQRRGTDGGPRGDAAERQQAAEGPARGRVRRTPGRRNERLLVRLGSFGVRPVRRRLPGTAGPDLVARADAGAGRRLAPALELARRYGSLYGTWAP